MKIYKGENHNLIKLQNRRDKLWDLERIMVGGLLIYYPMARRVRVQAMAATEAAAGKLSGVHERT